MEKKLCELHLLQGPVLPAARADTLAVSVAHCVAFDSKSIIQANVAASRCAFWSFSEQFKTNGVTFTGEINKHDPHSATCFFSVVSLKTED